MKIRILILLIVRILHVWAKDIELNEFGKFDNILVSIDSDVPFHPDIVKNIKFAFSDASDHLSKASRINGSGPFYFGEVYILIPDSWNNSEVDAIDKKDTTWQTPNSAHFRVSLNSDMIPRTEYAEKTCGEAGTRVRINYKQIIDSFMLMTLGKQLVREFASLRYGVFDEFNGSGGPHVYYDVGKWLPVTCSMTIKGEFKRNGTGDPCNPGLNNTHSDPNCLFETSPSPVQKAQGSLMFTSYLASVEKFCSSHSNNSELEHNSKAPNPQNNLCNKQSVQSVMLRHSDYKRKIDGAVFNRTKLPRVKFSVVKRNPKKRLVIIMDVSGSMAGDPIDFLKRSIIEALKLVPINEFFVGIIAFNSAPKTLHPLELFTMMARNTYIETTKSLTADGNTAIGDAMAEGMKELGVNLILPSKDDVGYILLISDGLDGTNQKLSLTGAADTVKKTSIVVHVIAISSQADNRLYTLFKSTGGQSKLVTPQANIDFNRMMHDMFQNMIGNQRVLLFIRNISPSSTLPVSVGSSKTGYLIFQISSLNIADIKTTELDVKSPNGTVYSRLSSGYDRDDTNGFITIKIDTNTEVSGNWTIIVFSLSATTNVRKRRYASANGAPITFSVYSQVTSDLITLEAGIIALTPEGFSHRVDKMNLELHRDYPLKVAIRFSKNGGLVIVKAKCTFTIRGDKRNYVENMEIRDDGINPDREEGDGYLSAWIPQTIRNIESYTVVVTCENNELIREAYANFRISSVNEKSFEKPHPPARIIDFRTISYVGSKPVKVVIKFTAVGESFMEGTASRYFIWACPDHIYEKEKILQSTECIQRDITSFVRVPASTRVEFELYRDLVDRFNTTFYTWVAAQDSHGQLAAFSGSEAVHPKTFMYYQNLNQQTTTKPASTPLNLELSQQQTSAEERASEVSSMAQTTTQNELFFNILGSSASSYNYPETSVHQIILPAAALLVTMGFWFFH